LKLGMGTRATNTITFAAPQHALHRSNRTNAITYVGL
jgi:hypothetical protein